jgi:L-lactate dehydrogenase complex protein LldE
MKVALFVPCYIDAVYPKVAIATLGLLEKLGVEVVYPEHQTCCGQPMANEGDQDSAARAEALFCENFAGYDMIVSPGGSCVKHVRMHMDAIEQTPAVKKVRESTFELVEFICGKLGDVTFPWARFDHTVAIHNSCSSIRGLHIADRSEWMEPRFDKPRDLLEKVAGITIKTIDRPDECCGFGGTFCATDAAVAARMAEDKLDDYICNGVEYVVSPDMSCLMHQSGVAGHKGVDLKFVHIAQVLNNGPF